MKVVAINVKTGSKYVYYEKTLSGRIYAVSTLNAWPNIWLVDSRYVEFIK